MPTVHAGITIVSLGDYVGIPFFGVCYSHLVRRGHTSEDNTDSQQGLGLNTCYTS